MRNPFRFMGTLRLNGEKADKYIYKNLSVIVSRGDFDSEQNKKVGANQEVLHISFSSLNDSAMRERDISDCLDYFGLDRASHSFTFERCSAFPPHKLIKHYEQIQGVSKPQYGSFLS